MIDPVPARTVGAGIAGALGYDRLVIVTRAPVPDRAARRGRGLAIGALLALAFAALVTAGSAVAHVDVLPSETTAGEAQLFTIRVPAERGVDTVRVEVGFPDEVLVYSVKPTPGWTSRFLYRPDRRTRGIVFSGGRIGPGGFQEFDILGTPQQAGTAVWTARQVYADGLVKLWTAPPERPGEEEPETGPDEPGPASATTILEAGVPVGPAAQGGDGSDDSGSDSSSGVWLGLIAIGISVAAALGVGLLWSTRPARLPDDR